MGTCCFPNDIYNIDLFNKKYNDTDYENTKIELKTKECILHNIGEEGFIQFCSLNLIEITFLNLSNNNIENITALQNFKAPKLEKLDLSYNSIINIDILENLKYPLKELDLRYNAINDITIFKNDNVLPKLTKLFLNNNYFDSEDKENENIMIHLNERMKKNIENSCLEYKNNDSDYQSALTSIKTINDKFLDSSEKKINIFDKDAIDRIETLKNKNEGEKDQFDECIQNINKVQRSVIKSINTLKLKNSDGNINNSSNSFLKDNEDK